jgi:hypothetical protein
MEQLMKRRSFLRGLSSGAAFFSGISVGPVLNAQTDAVVPRQAQCNLLDLVPTGEHAAIAAGSSTYDVTGDFQRAIDSYTHVVLPAGHLNVNTASITLRSGTRLTGQGIGKTTLYGGFKFGAYGMLYANSMSPDISRNLTNIEISDLTIDGKVVDLGYQPFTHLISLHGVTGVTIQRVEVKGFRGDGIYLGSGPHAKEERHNADIKISDCRFDGLIKSNRNGLTCIDCDNLSVENCQFENIGNSSLSASVGAIDFEPDQSISRYRNVVIKNCHFKNIDSTNTAAITFFNGRQKDGNIHDWAISDCVFESCFWGVVASAIAKVPSDVSDNLSIKNCKFINSKSSDLALRALSGVIIDSCSFEVSHGSTLYRGGVVAGFASSTCRNAINWKVTNCTFAGLRPQVGVFAINGARGLVVEGNTFTDISGAIFGFPSDKASGLDRYLAGIRISNNKVANPSARTGSGPKTSFFVQAAAGINVDGSNSFINSSCIEENNTLNDGIIHSPSGTLTIFNGQVTAAAPNSGTWDVGTGTKSAKGNRFECRTAGTFGSLEGVSADVENDSELLRNVVDSNKCLREGHVINVAGSSGAYKVLSISADTIRLSSKFKGNSAKAMAIAWVPPQFS